MQPSRKCDTERAGRRCASEGSRSVQHRQVSNATQEGDAMKTYRVKYTRTWVRIVNAESREDARDAVKDSLANDDTDVEDYNDSTVTLYRFSI